MTEAEHEDHRLVAERAARVLAFTELEGDHELVETLVYEQADVCWQCIAVELVKLLRDPVDPETFREEADAIKRYMWSEALSQAKRAVEAERPRPDSQA